MKYYIKDRWVLRQQVKQLQNLTQEPILIFTMAKVGSSSVYQSLKKQSEIPCFHIHSLSKEEELEAIRICKEKGVYPGSRTPVFALHKHIFEKQKPYKVISLFRNPIERNLSAFFDAFEIHMGMPAPSFKGNMKDIEEAFYQKLDHSYCKDWFDVQFKQGIGVDVYEYAFLPAGQAGAKAEGHSIVQSNDTDILLLKNTLDDKLKSKLVGDFCGVTNFKLTNVNVTDAKKEATLYSEFKSYIRFPKEYLESQLESRYVNHFFTKEEKEALYERWSVLAPKK